MTKTIIYSRELSRPIAIYLLILFSCLLAIPMFYGLWYIMQLLSYTISTNRNTSIGLGDFIMLTPIIVTGVNLIIQPLSNSYLALKSKTSIYQIEVLSAFYQRGYLACLLQSIVIISGVVIVMSSFPLFLYVGANLQGILLFLGIFLPAVVSISLPFIRISDEITQISSGTL